MAYSLSALSSRTADRSMNPLPPGTRKKVLAFRPFALVAAALTLALAATGCGNRGPLYLPDDPEPVTTIDTQTEAGSKTEAKADEEDAKEDTRKGDGEDDGEGTSPGD